MAIFNGVKCVDKVSGGGGAGKNVNTNSAIVVSDESNTR